jgi:hypothetical protein
MPQKPRSSNVFTFALRSMNGVGSSWPFLITRMTPFFSQMNSRPSGAHAIPTSEYGGKLAIVSVAKPLSLNVSATARSWNENAPARASASASTA